MSAPALDQALEEAVRHHQSGRLELAEQSYRHVLELAPGHPDALHLLGVATLQGGRSELAIELIRQALPHLETDPAIHSNLGEAYRQAGRFEAAVASFQRAVELQPEFAAGHANLGRTLSDLARWDEAINAFVAALRHQPDDPEVLLGLGSALLKRGLFDQAVTTLKRAIQVRPRSAEAHCLLADALREAGQIKPAVAVAQRALDLNAEWPATYFCLGATLRSAGQLAESIQTLQRAAQRWPQLADAHYNLATALSDAGRFEEAVAAFRQVLDLEPDAVDALYNLANTLRSSGALQEALACYQRVLQFRQDFPDAWNNLGGVLKNQGHIQEALFAYREAVRLQPSCVDAHSNLLLTLHYLPTVTPSELAVAHRSWARLHESPIALAARREVGPRRILRIGYVSPDFREHPVASFMEALLANHDRSAFEIYCYSNTARPDAVTARLQKHATRWIEIARLTDAAVVERIRQDEIDILVDLAGHTSDHRLLCFAAQPAPVQVSYLGYCDTTGMERIQYRITDSIADPVEEHAYSSEKLVRLPDVFACFQPLAEAPAVAPSPAITRGYVTFASFHTPAKLNVVLLTWWARILKGTPGSRLLFLARGLQDGATRHRIVSLLEQQGIDADRFVFATERPLPEYLALHAEVDILLDSYPFNGHTVACHALWMGVPVVTLAGKIHCSRMVASVLTVLQLEEWIAATPDDYVARAVALANDLLRLQSLRETMRARMAVSPLTDGSRFAAAMENAYRTMWSDAGAP